jgi:hypothetical protein
VELERGLSSSDSEILGDLGGALKDVYPGSVTTGVDVILEADFIGLGSHRCFLHAPIVHNYLTGVEYIIPLKIHLKLYLNCARMW